MKHLYFLMLLIITLACTENNSNSSANIIGSLDNKSADNLSANLDSFYLPWAGNGIKHILPQKDFTNDYVLFQEMLQEFMYVELPYELDGLAVDRTDEEWNNQPVLNKKFYRYLMDGKDFHTVEGVLSPRESFEDFYKVYPVAKLGEKEFYHTVIYLVRYLDGNGQQDFFYLTTFNSEGTFLSAIEIGALEASAETYIKTAEISSDNIIKVYHADFDSQTDNWIKKSESQYYLDNTGQVYNQFENKPVGITKTEKSSETASFVTMSDFQNYFNLFQKEVVKNAPDKILNYVTFPHFRVSYEEHYQDIKSKEEFFAQYDIIFNESLRKKIANHSFNDLILNGDEVGLSDGSMWFKRIGRDNDGRLIIAISVN